MLKRSENVGKQMLESNHFPDAGIQYHAPTFDLSYSRFWIVSHYINPGRHSSLDMKWSVTVIGDFNSCDSYMQGTYQ